MLEYSLNIYINYKTPKLFIMSDVNNYIETLKTSMSAKGLPHDIGKIANIGLQKLEINDNNENVIGIKLLTKCIPTLTKSIEWILCNGGDKPFGYLYDNHFEGIYYGLGVYYDRIGDVEKTNEYFTKYLFVNDDNEQDEFYHVEGQLNPSIELSYLETMLHFFTNTGNTEMIEKIKTRLFIGFSHNNFETGNWFFEKGFPEHSVEFFRNYLDTLGINLKQRVATLIKLSRTHPELAIVGK